MVTFSPTFNIYNSYPLLPPGHKELGGMWFRMSLKPPNLLAKDWWSDADLKISTTMSTPVRGSSLCLTDAIGHRTLNEAVVKQLHNRSVHAFPGP